MPPLAIAGAGLGVAAGVGSYFAGRSQAEAQGDAAKAQLQAAGDTRSTVMTAAEDAARSSAPSADELNALKDLYDMRSRMLTYQKAAMDRDESIINAVDPAIKEAGSQAYRLMQGQEAAVLQPFKAEFDRKRQELQARLREQLGPGFESSTAGILALSKFDMQSQMAMSQIQSNALGQLMGAALQGRQLATGDITAATQAANQTFQQYFSESNTLRQRQMQGQGMIIGAALQSGQQVAQYAGAPFVQAAGNAQALGGLFNTIGNLGGQAIGYSALAGRAPAGMANPVGSSAAPGGPLPGAPMATGLPLPPGYSGGL